MDTKETTENVSLPSGTHTTSQTTINEQGDKSAIDTDVVENVGTGKVVEEIETIEAVIVKDDNDVNLDDDFEKILPVKLDRSSEEGSDDVDHEIAEILCEAEPLGHEIKAAEAPEIKETNVNPPEIVSENEISVTVEQAAPVVDNDKQAKLVIKTTETIEVTEVSPESTKEAVAEKLTEILEVAREKVDKALELVSQSEDFQKMTISTEKVSEKPKEIEKPPKEIAQQSQATGANEDAKQTSINDDPISSVDKKLSHEDDKDKPPVPLQTYMWEDLKRAKEQGGYPWTHLYKDPLGPDDDPQSILSYKQSPRAARRASNGSSTPKSQKKVRIQDEVEVEGEVSDDDATEMDTSEAILETDAVGVTKEEASEPSKPSKSILKSSPQTVETPKPEPKKTDSLKKRIKNPLQKIKKMADQQFKKVKSSRPFVKTIPVSKDEIVLAEEVKILKLKESPKSLRREIPSYIVKHQDSEDSSLSIAELTESPSGTRKRREAESHLVKPDEVIDLPKVEKEKSATPKMPSREMSIDSHGNPKKQRDHDLEDMEEYISRITSDPESVELAEFQQHPKPQHHDQVISFKDDPMLEEFSRLHNSEIRRSLSIHDDKAEKARHEFVKKIPRLAELGKELSRERTPEKKSSEKAKAKHSDGHRDSIDSQGNPRRRHDENLEDMDEYISRITSDPETVERSAYKHHPAPQQHEDSPQFTTDPIHDPMFDEFSRDLNKKIAASLSSQDEKFKHELFKKIPRIEELEKQISEEDKSEKSEGPAKVNTALLAPISSIDSTSSDEDRAVRLSILAEESEASDSKKKSFDLESSVDSEIESLKTDGSDVSVTLMEDLILKPKDELEVKPEEQKINTEKPIESQPVESAPPEPKTEPPANEDVVVKEDIEVTKKPSSYINKRWSKMRRALRKPKSIKKHFDIGKLFNKCLPLLR